MINDRLYVLRSRWENYVHEGSFEHFIEFTVAVNSLAEHFNRVRLPGLVRICEGLENAALARLGTPVTHPIAAHEIAVLQRQVDGLLGAVASSRLVAPERRAEEQSTTLTESDWIKPRSVWLVVAREVRDLGYALRTQLDFFGFQTQELIWGGQLPAGDIPLAVLFLPPPGTPNPRTHSAIAAIRERCPASQLIFLGARPDIATIVGLMRAGIDLTIPQGIRDGLNQRMIAFFILEQRGDVAK